uniref:Uncharacterized protein n=1 Tax=Glossina morsitans morsitans TaxID=37546 RepID=A0A1B0FEL4_GLOMM
MLTFGSFISYTLTCMLTVFYKRVKNNINCGRNFYTLRLYIKLEFANCLLLRYVSTAMSTIFTHTVGLSLPCYPSLSYIMSWCGCKKQPEQLKIYSSHSSHRSIQNHFVMYVCTRIIF